MQSARGLNLSRESDALQAELERLESGQAAGGNADSSLRPLVQAAATLRELRAQVPSAVADERARLALRSAPFATQPPTISRWMWRAAVALVVVVALSVGTASILGSFEALPNSPLYTVRGWQESVRIALAESPTQRAALYADFALARAEQVHRLARSHNANHGDSVEILLRDLVGLATKASGQAVSNGSAARSTVKQAESRIVQELRDAENENAFSESESRQLSQAITQVEAVEPVEPVEAPRG